MERKELLSKAEELGLEFPKNISSAKLADMVEEAGFAAKDSAYEKPVDTDGEVVKVEKVKENKPKIAPAMAANRLIRCIITPMADDMRDIPSEMYSVGRSTTGFIKKVVKFNKETREPIAILRHLKGKTRLVQVDTKKPGVKKLERMPAFNIQVIPELPIEVIERELAEAKGRKKAK